jgi:hypothetical protein
MTAVAEGVGRGVGLAVGVGVGLGVGLGVGDGVGLGVGLGVGRRVGTGVGGGVGSGVGDGEGDGVSLGNGVRGDGDGVIGGRNVGDGVCSAATATPALRARWTEVLASIRSEMQSRRMETALAAPHPSFRLRDRPHPPNPRSGAEATRLRYRR